MHQQTLALREAVLGHGHPDTRQAEGISECLKAKEEEKPEPDQEQSVR